MRRSLRTGLFFFSLMLFYTSQAQTEAVTMHLRNASLSEVISAIEEQTNYHFLINEELIDLSLKSDVQYDDIPLIQVMESVFIPLGIYFRFEGQQIVLLPSSDSPREKKMLKGIVVDKASGMPLAGVNIRILNSDKGTISKADGTFEIPLADRNLVLIFSYIGYEKTEVTTEITNSLTVKMEEQITELEGVVVTALGLQRNENALGYATQSVSGEALQRVKGVNPATSLTGKVSGLMIKNSSNFGIDPVMKLRGEEPLIVIDGIPAGNMNMNDLSPDDIIGIDVLKGATASALYGFRGANGAIMITTKQTDRENGIAVFVNSSAMLNLGYVSLPETQSSYSSGFNGHYGNDYVWGDRLDIGRTATLWDPEEKVWLQNVPLRSTGKNNLKNFQELGILTNTSLKIVNQGPRGVLHTSVSHIYNKGQFPNQHLQKITYSLGGKTSFGAFSIESGLNYSKQFSPNIWGSQYSGGYLYNLIGWLGAEWDVREYRDYWLKKDEEQNWFNEEWYDNPWFLANEVLKSSDHDIYNGFINTTCRISSSLELIFRSGVDSYINRYNSRNPVGTRNAWSYYGFYREEKYSGYSTNNDLMISFKNHFGRILFDGITGGTIYFWKNDYNSVYTRGGLSVPGFYSLSASVDPVGWETWMRRQQVNSLFGRVSIAFDNFAFLDLTGRNDWSSTLSSDQRSYFYPSVGLSFLPSSLIQDKKWITFWKIRASWTQSKTPPGVYEINNSFSIQHDVWDGMNAASYTNRLRSVDTRPQSSKSFEIGTTLKAIQNRLFIDLTGFRKLMYDFLVASQISDASGFTSRYTNSDERWLKKGFEVVIGGDPVLNEDWKWSVQANWSGDVTTYAQLDAVHSPDNLWTKKGARVDAYTVRDWVRSPDGQLVNDNGFPVRSSYFSVAGNSNPDWIYGINTLVKYRNISLSCSFDGRYGGVSFSRLDALLWNSGAHKGTDNVWRFNEVVNGQKNYIGKGVRIASGTVAYDSYGSIVSDSRVFVPNDVQVSYESYMRSHYALGAWSYCRQDILDETFIKLRELSLTFTFPRQWLESLRMKDASLSIIGQNLWYRGKEYKYADPDFGETWDLVSPSIRYGGLNLAVKF